MDRLNLSFHNIMNDIWMLCHAKGNKYWPKVPDQLWTMRLMVTQELKTK